MKKTLLTAVSLVALGSASALAADLPARTYTKAPAVAAAPSWTGFYVGAMGGYGKENTSATGALDGGFAGGTLGYNWQAGMMVYGLEADAAWSNIGATVGIPGLLTVSDKMQALGTVRGRVGVAFDQVLLYGTGGFAWASNKITATVLGASLADTQTLTGWTAGAGVEWMFAPKWSVKAEYLYRSFSSQTYFASQLPPGVATGTVAINSGQVGINYHF